MRVAILHISDIHADEEASSLLARYGAVVDATKTVDYEGVDAAVVAISGDIARTGTENEYIIAWDFLEKVKEGLTRDLLGRPGGNPVPVYFVAVPGNHDCMFSQDGRARDMVAAGVCKDRPGIADESVVGVCTEVQDLFFGFLNAEAEDGYLSKHPGLSGRVYYEYAFRIADEDLRFMCCNTAWISSIEEKQGHLFFPVAMLPEQPTPGGVVIAMFHHPYAWLQAENMREFRERIERCADVILTGHEHDSTYARTERSTGECNVYIEGSAFQAQKAEGSGFNVLLIDTNREGCPKQKFCQFQWDRDGYILGPGTAYEDDGVTVAWQDFQVTRLRRRNHFVLRKDFEQALSDTGVTLQHPHKDPLTLSDVYVYPDLLELRITTSSTPVRVKSEQVPNLPTECPYLFLAGEDQSGKTSLCKMLFRKMLSDGKTPVLVDGRTVKRLRGSDKIVQFIEGAFQNEYEGTGLGAFKRRDRAERAIILDDFHKIGLTGKERQAFVETLTAYAGCVVLVGDQLALTVDEQANPACISNNREAFALYAIQPLGHRLRSDLVEKWLLIGATGNEDSLAFAQTLRFFTGILDTLIGMKHVPAYPVYVLAILQAGESTSYHDLSANTHAHFYEIFIRKALARGKSGPALDISMTFLSHLAYDFYKTRASAADFERLSGIFGAYTKARAITLRFESLHNELVAHGLLRVVDDETSFRYPSIYYYFAASYFRDHIGEPEIRSQITDMSKRLFVVEYANIMLFLCHLSKEPFIVEEMLSAADMCYAEVKPAELAGDVAFLNRMGDGTDALALEHGDARTTRQQVLEVLDKSENAPGQNESRANDIHETVDSEMEVESALAQLNGSLKTLQILGQILKTFPGSTLAEEKLRIANACYGIGMRTTAQWLGLFRDGQEGLCRILTSVLSKQHRGWAPEQLQRRARECVVHLATLFSFSMIHRISLAMGSPMLRQTYEEMARGCSAPSMYLVDLSLSLDHADGFPAEDIAMLAKALRPNAHTYSILRYLVFEHLCLFPVIDHRKKDKVCQALGISQAYVFGGRSERKLIEG